MPSSFNAYLLRIELSDFKPEIYREVLVDSNITLRKLHAVIQAAMGWENSHLYAFAQPLRAADNFWKKDPGVRPRGQVLPFAPTPINLPPWLALFALNSPARFTT
jgi:hypothetical protein